MADIKGIELASEIYGLEDETARDTATTASQTATQAGQTATQASQTATQASQTATQASQTATEADSKIGTLADLQTTVKTNLVAAINEVKNEIPKTETPITTTVHGIAFWAKKSGGVVTVSYNGQVDEDELGVIYAEGFLPVGWRPSSPYPKAVTFDDEERPNGVCYANASGGIALYAQFNQDWAANDSISGTITFVV